MEASGQAYTEALSELYPTRADVAAEIAELEAPYAAALNRAVPPGHPWRVQRLLPRAARWLRRGARAHRGRFRQHAERRRESRVARTRLLSCRTLRLTP